MLDRNRPKQDRIVLTSPGDEKAFVRRGICCHLELQQAETAPATQTHWYGSVGDSKYWLEFPCPANPLKICGQGRNQREAAQTPITIALYIQGGIFCGLPCAPGAWWG